MEELLRALGADPVIWAQRTECCGCYIRIENEAQAQKQSRKIQANALDAGAEMLVTACPLCRYNLENSGGAGVPTVYFTELLAEALGVKEDIR
jgi:heterodisulfide reductase subunit B